MKVLKVRASDQDVANAVEIFMARLDDHGCSFRECDDEKLYRSKEFRKTLEEAMQKALERTGNGEEEYDVALYEDGEIEKKLLKTIKRVLKSR